MKTTSRLVCLIFAVLLASPALALNATWNAATDIPVTVASYAASGALNLTLNFAPPTGTNLTVVNNTGPGFISGTFSNLAQGQVVSLGYGGVNYPFVANYYGGTGNDLVLVWANNAPYGWGYNLFGQLGNNAITESHLPTAVVNTGALSGKTVISIAAGTYHTLALCSDGTIAGWGDNGYGDLGNNSTAQSNVPVVVNTASGVSALYGKTVIAIAAGDYHSLALCSDGTVASWGYNFNGQLGTNSMTESHVPVAVSTVSGLSALFGKTVIAIAAGTDHSVALCSDGTVATWGYNYTGQLGNNTTTDSLVPVGVNTTSGVSALFGKTVSSIATGSYHTLALCSDGTVTAWGLGSSGEMGNNNTVYANVAPVAVNAVSGISSLYGKTVTGIAAGEYHSLALCSDGTLATWGENQRGQLGDNTTTERNVPVAVNAVSGVSALYGRTAVGVSAGNKRNLVTCSDGTMVAWGENYVGQLGDNTIIQRNVPVLVNTTLLPTGSRFSKGACSGGDYGASCFAVGAFPVGLPIVTTFAASPITSTGATLTGGVNANNASTAVSFDYGTTASYGTNILGSPTPVTGASATSVSATVAGLLPGTTYHYRGNGLNSSGTSRGNDLTFTTLSTNANLSNLTLSAGTLSPVFASGTTGYTASVSSVTTSATVTPTVAESNATVTVNGVAVASGIASGGISIAVGSNTITTVVTAQDGVTTKTYTVTVTRPAPSANANLSNLVLSVGTLTSAFSSGTTSYTASVSNATNSITVTPTVADSTATLAVNGITLASGSASVAIGLGAGPNTITTLVTAQDGVTTKSYTVTVTRSGSGSNLAAIFNTSTDVPVTASSYTATGNTVSFSLNFAPATGTSLTVVNNTGPAFITGTFSNLAQGQTVSLSYGGMNYIFVADYYGGTGNDLVLEWANRRTLAWGYNNEGELGSTSVSNYLVPNAVTATGVLLGKTVVALSAGQYHSIARCLDGTVATWGWNFYGQLGNNSNTTSYVPATVNATSGVSALYGKIVVGVAAGAYHNVALCSDGNVTTWGYNTVGQLGNNTTTNSSVPVSVITSGALLGKVVVGVAAGAYHTLALCSDGTVVAWGSNNQGQLGNNTTISSSVPVAVSIASGALSGKTVIAIAAGSFHSIALCSDGTLAAWGYNGNGQLGDNSFTDSQAPVSVNRVSGVSALYNKTVVKLVGLSYSTLAVCFDGTVASWGTGSDGELGNNSTSGSPIPISVNTTSGVSALFGKTVTIAAGGTYHSLARCSDGTLVAWGANYDGQMGNNSTTSSTVPVSVSTTTLAAGEKWMSAASGSNGYHSLGIVAAPLSTNANLTNLVMSTGTLSPSFSSATSSYTSNVPNSATSITVTPTVADNTATVKVNGVAVSSGSASGLINLNVGTNIITTVVTAQDGTTKTYTLALMRLNSLGPISGTRTVGPTGDYASLTAAIADVQTGGNGLGGALVLELQATYLGAVETYPLIIPALNGASATNTFTIRPASGATALSISSADTTAATVDLNGAQFVTIDGRPGGAGTVSQLSIANTSVAGVALRFINEASSNTVRYVALQGVNTSATSGVVVFSTTTGVNGNDSNLIDRCDIRDGASTPTNGIYALGTTTTTATNNSGNSVSNCNVFNFYAAAAVDSAGVRLDGGNTDWTISGNSFYQTASRAAVTATVQAIYLNNSFFGNNFTVTGNVIGGSAANAGGSAWTTTGTAALYRFVGIHLNIGTATPSSVQGNTIRNMVWTSSSNSGTLPGVWSGIYVQSGVANVGTAAGNTIGSDTGNGSLSVTTNGGTTFGIGSDGSTVAIANNTIGSITVNATVTSNSASLTGIRATSGVMNISNNLIGSTTTANSLNAATVSTASSGQQVSGIFSSAVQATITGNTVANLNSNDISANSGQIRGIVTTQGTNAVTGNTVRNLSSASTNASIGVFTSVVGIYHTSTTAGQTVSQNVVHSLSNTTASAGVKVTGIYCQGANSGSTLFARNLVHSLAISSTGATSAVNGMQFDGQGFTAQNNMVRVGINASGVSTAGASIVRGIFDNGLNGGWNFYHNSVYVGGTQTLGANSTYAFNSVATTNARAYQNNIFVNARSNSGGTGKHYAVSYAGTGVNPTGLTSGGNIFLASGTGGVLGLYNSADRATLSVWQSATGQDTTSAVVDPLFINATGTSATADLHLQPNNPAEGGSFPIAAVTDDFDGQTRSNFTPTDIGADAGNFTSTGDVFAPAISYTPLTSGTPTNRTLTGFATIVDNVGVAGGASAPRLYYKKSTDADAFGMPNNSIGNGWKYVTASNGSSPYSFTIDYTLLNSGVTNGDTIQYFVVAQDAANNLGSGPAGAAASVNPPAQNVNAHGAVNSYMIFRPVTAINTIGAGGDYPSLSGASGIFTALNNSVLAGNTVIKLTSDVAEDGSVTLNQWTESGIGNYTVTIQPDSATMRTISGTSATGLITLNGANRVAIDGRFGGTGRYLTFRNTSTGISACTIRLINDASNNTVRSCIVEGATTNNTNGVIAFGIGLTTGNDNNLIADCRVRDLSTGAGVPSILIGSYGSSLGSNSGNTLSNNELFNFNNDGIYITSTGNDLWAISGNNIYEVNAATSGPIGIEMRGSGSNVITGNFIHDLLTTSTVSKGISVGNNSSATISRNRITAFNVNAATTSVYGIFADPGSSTLNVVNNEITLIPVIAGSVTLYGLYDNGSTFTALNAFYNSIVIGGTESGVRNSWASLRVSTFNTHIARNNIFFNNRAGGTGSHFAGGREGSGGGYTASNNVYAGTGATAATFMDFSGASGTVVPVSFTTWQSSTGDTASLAGIAGTGNFTAAMFVDAANGDLHIVPAGNPLVSGTGTPIAGVTTDFDGDPRSATAPNIGADEISAPIIATNPSDTTVNIGANATFMATATGAPVPTVQWQVNTGSGFANLPSETATTLTITGATFSLNGNQYRAVFTNIVGTANSNAAVLTVNRPPVANPVTVTRYPTQGTKLSAAQIIAQTSDPDAGDTVSLVSVGNVTAPAHGAVLLNVGFVFYTPNANDQNADTFSYTVQDSHGATATGTVNVNIIVDNAPSQNITKLTVLPNGDVTIDFSGIPGFTYGLQFSPDLIVPWVNIGPVTTNGFGAAHAVDTPAHGPGGSGFYRLVYPAPAGL